MTTTQKRLCRIIGLLGIACAGFALHYNADVSFRVFSKPTRPGTPVYFKECFVLLTTIAVVVAAGVAYGSVELIRLRRRGGVVTTAFSCAPVGLILIVGTSWHIPHFGMSIGAASGVSMGGLAPILLTLLPLWAALITHSAFRPSEGLKASPA